MKESSYDHELDGGDTYQVSTCTAVVWSQKDNGAKGNFREHNCVPRAEVANRASRTRRR